YSHGVHIRRYRGGTCASTKNAPKPTASRALCRITALVLSAAALYSTTRPITATIASSASSGTSTCSASAPRLRRRNEAPLERPQSAAASDIVVRQQAEIGVQDLPRDRRRGAVAAAAVLDDDPERDPRRLGGRERDEETVIAKPLVDLVLAVPRVLRDGEHLRGAGLAGDRVRRAFHRHGRGAAGLRGHAEHRRRDQLPVVLVDVVDAGQLLGGDPLDPAAHALLAADDDARREAAAFRREHGGRVRELQRRDERVALADAADHGLAREPHLVLAAGEVAAFPFPRRHDARVLAADVDAGRRAEAEAPHARLEVVDAERERELIEVHVAGADDR